MRFITCASYHGSGSSAVTDLISEFDEVKSCGVEEFRFMHDSDGVADLEYNLVWNFNRVNTSRAINRYLKIVDYYNGSIFGKKYRGIFGDSWKDISYDYINQISDFSYNGTIFDINAINKSRLFIERVLSKILHYTFWRKEVERDVAGKKELVYCGHPSEEKFLECTRNYINELFNVIRGNNQFLMVDQIVPPSNTERFLRYFDDIKVIIVDRDPRDLFLLEKNHWQDGVIPTDVEKFCKWFTYTRDNGSARRIVNNQIRFLWFEDLIYKYDKTVEMLISWLGLDAAWHTKKKQIFNPNKSINNTRLWKKEKCNSSEIKYIESELKDYLYWSK